jgi:hypothetical protein
MKKYTYILFLIFAGMAISSCNDWLDVKPDTQVEEDNMFKNYQGYRSALTGCYMSLASTSIYGERLTMTNIESLADLWYMTDASVHSDDYNLMNHNYTQDDAKSAIKSIYGELFNVIVQANMIIKHIENSNAIESEKQAQDGLKAKHTHCVPFVRWTYSVCSARCLKVQRNRYLSPTQRQHLSAICLPTILSPTM